MATNYTGNSIKNKDVKAEGEVKKEIQKVVKGGVKTKKKSEISKIATSMISDEAKSIKEYAIYEVVIPVIKDTIIQLVEGSINMIFHGEARSSSRGRNSYSSKVSKVSYKDCFDDKNDRGRNNRQSANRFSYDDISFTYKQDADAVLISMDEIVEQYGIVTVADLFDLAGMSGNGYTDQNYGWTNTRSASVERSRDGEYFLKLQRPSNIK